WCHTEFRPLHANGLFPGGRHCNGRTLHTAVLQASLMLLCCDETDVKLEWKRLSCICSSLCLNFNRLARFCSSVTIRAERIDLMSKKVIGFVLEENYKISG